jgi:Family of unknown function (DUF6629)
VSPVCGCFSAEVDLLAGLAIGAIAIDGLRFVDERRKLLLAAIPLTLAIHQLVEVGAWWGLQGEVPEAVGTLSIYAYLVIALVVVPVLVPTGVFAAERDPLRRRWMAPFVGLGILTALVLAASLVVGPVSATLGSYAIDYRIASVGPDWGSVVYLAVVAVPLLLSSRRLLVGLGLINLALVAGIGWLNANGYISLWCGAAALQGAVIVHMLRSEAGKPWVWPAWSESLRIGSRSG